MHCKSGDIDYFETNNFFPMRHRKKQLRRFGHKPDQHSRSVLRNLATSFFEHKALVTTQKRAHALSGVIDELVRMVNTTDHMNAIRKITSFLYTESASRALIEDIAPRYSDRTSGCTRLTAIKLRDGDSAKLVKIELV